MEAQAAQRMGHVQALAKVKVEVHVPGWERVGVGGVPSWENYVLLGCCVAKGKWPDLSEPRLGSSSQREDKSSDRQSVRLEGGAGAQESLQDLAHSRHSGNEFPIFPEPPLPCPWPWGVTGSGWASGRRGLGRLGH